jgi:RNA polymerase sigma-70 factor (ECF subfamily)
LPLDDPLSDFEKFVRANEAQIVALGFMYTGSPQDAHDLAQETFARVWQNWERLESHGNREAWSRRVLHNLAVSRWRRLRLERRHASTGPASMDGPDAGHLDVVRMINRLPTRQRRALVLHAVLGLSVEEIAAEMRAPAGTVRSWLHRARTSMSSQLDRDQVVRGSGIERAS